MHAGASRAGLRARGRSHLFPHVYHKVDKMEVFSTRRRASRALAMVRLPSNYPYQMYGTVAGGQPPWQAGVRPPTYNSTQVADKQRPLFCAWLPVGTLSLRPNSFNLLPPGGWVWILWLWWLSASSYKGVTSSCGMPMTWSAVAPSTFYTKLCSVFTPTCPLCAGVSLDTAGHMARITTSWCSTCTYSASTFLSLRSARSTGRSTSCAALCMHGRRVPFMNGWTAIISVYEMRTLPAGH